MKSSLQFLRKRPLLLLLIGALLAILAVNCGKKTSPLPPQIIAPTPPETRLRQSGDLMLFSFQLPSTSTDQKTPVDIGKIEIYKLKDPRVLLEPQTQTQTQTQTAPQTPTSSHAQTQSLFPQTAPQTQAQTQTSPQTQTIPSLFPQAAPQTQTQSQTQTAPQTQTQSQSQTQPQTQTQSQTAPAHPEEAREIDPVEFKSRSEKIAELSADQIDAYTREGFFYYTEKVNLQTGSEDLQNWSYYGAKIFNKKGKSAGFTKLSALFPSVVPKAPANFTATVTPGDINLTWTPVTQDIAGNTLYEGSVGYLIFRGSDANFAPEQPLTPDPVTTTTYTDTSFQYGQPYYYFVRAIHMQHKKAQQSAASNVLLMYPQDTFAPEPPQELNAVSAREGMVLIWSPNSEEDVAGYNIYRSSETGKNYQKINRELVRETTYTDADIRRKERYYYVITAVDNAPVPNESGYSSEISETAKSQ